MFVIENVSNFRYLDLCLIHYSFSILSYVRCLLDTYHKICQKQYFGLFFTFFYFILLQMSILILTTKEHYPGSVHKGQLLYCPRLRPNSMHLA